MSLTTGIPENKLRIIAPDVGGGFGAKLQFYREEILATVLANRLGRPIKWTESRSENMVATHHGRDQIQFIEMAATREGKILGMKVELLANMGGLPAIADAGGPGARSVHVQRHLQDGRLRLEVHRRLHHDHPDRRLPRRRAAGGHLRRRTDHRRISSRTCRSNRWSCAGGTGSSTRNSRTPPSPG